MVRIKKKTIFIVCISLVLIAAISVSAILIFGKKDKGTSIYDSYFSYNENTSVEIGTKYSLSLSLKEGVTLDSVKLTDENNAETALAEDYSFTPEKVGCYYYDVTATRKGYSKSKRITITAYNSAAPVVKKTVGNKRGELGVYSDFERDLSELEIESTQANFGTFNMKVVRISHGESFYEDISGISYYVLKAVGEYTVRIKISDMQGNYSYSEYVIEAVDTTAPTIDLPSVVYGYVSEGKVCVPQPDIYDLSSYELTVLVRHGNDKVTVENGKFAAAVNEEFTVTYRAVDAYGNANEKSCVLKVADSGKIIDFSDDYALKSFFTRTSVAERYKDDFVSFTTNSSSDEITLRGEAINIKDVSGFKGLRVGAENLKSAHLKIAVKLLADGSEKEVGEFELAGNESRTIYLPLSGAECKELNGITLSVNSDNRISFALREMTFVSEDGDFGGTEKDTSDKNRFDFENDAKDYIFIGNGFEVNKNSSYVSCGESSLKTTLYAGEIAGFSLVEPYGNGEYNFVNLTVFSSKNALLSFNLKYGDKTGEAFSVSIKRGVNEISLFTGETISDDFVGLIVRNLSKAGVEIYLDNLRFSSVTEFSDDYIFGSVSDIAVEKGYDYTLEKATKCSSSVIDKYTIQIINGADDTVLSEIYGGGKVNFGDEAFVGVDEIKIKHIVTDVLGGKHEVLQSCSVTDGVKYTVKMPYCYYGEKIYFPEVKDINDAEVTVRKYYKEEGAKYWKAVNDAVVIYKNTYFDVLYSIIDNATGKVTVINDKVYLRNRNTQVDFEIHPDGEHLGYYETTINNSYAPEDVSSVWSYDGRYSLHIPANFTWDSGLVLYFKDTVRDNSLVFDKPVDTVIFHSYAEKTMGSHYLWVAGTDNVWHQADITVKEGEQFHVVDLGCSFDKITKMSFGAKRYFDYYVDAISFITSAELGVAPVGSGYTVEDAVVIKKPVLKNYSDVVFTSDEVKNAIYSYKIVGDNDFVKSGEFTGNEFEAKFDKGSYTITYTVIIGSRKYVLSDEFEITYFNISFEDIPTAYELNSEYEWNLPETEDSAVVLKAYIREFGGEWSELSISGDVAKYTFEKIGRYEIKFTGTKGDVTEERVYKVNVRDSSFIGDFEKSDNNPQYGGEHFGYGNGAPRDAHVSDEWSYDGEYSLKVDAFYAGSWTTIQYYGGYNNGKPDSSLNLKKAYEYVTFVIYSDHEVKNWQICFADENRKWIYTDVFDIKQGEFRYVLKLGSPIERVSCFSFKVDVTNITDFYIDAIRFTDMPELAINNMATENTDTFIVPPAVEDCEVVVEIKRTDAEEYTALPKKDGKFVLNVSAGDYLIKCVYDFGGTKIEKVYEIKVVDILDDNKRQDIEWSFKT